MSAGNGCRVRNSLVSLSILPQCRWRLFLFRRGVGGFLQYSLVYQGLDNAVVVVVHPAFYPPPYGKSRICSRAEAAALQPLSRTPPCWGSPCTTVWSASFGIFSGICPCLFFLECVVGNVGNLVLLATRSSLKILCLLDFSV